MAAGGRQTWARQRLATGCAFNTIRVDAFAIQRFSEFPGLPAAGARIPQSIDRALLERYLAWLGPLPLADSTKAQSACTCGPSWRTTAATAGCPAIPAEATIYPDELSSRRHSLPRFIPEFVMGQLE